MFQASTQGKFGSERPRPQPFPSLLGAHCSQMVQTIHLTSTKPALAELRATAAGSGMDMKDGIKSTAAALSALEYGPQAVQKVMAMLGSSFQIWPPGKKVKIVFQERDTNTARNVAWMPEKQPLHEIIMRQSAIGNFTVSYNDEHGELWDVDATKEGIEEFLETHKEHPSPVLQVEWSPVTHKEVIETKVQKAKAWLTGEGDATDQAVKDAQDRVEKKGGKISVSSGSGRSLIDHKGYKKEDWPAVVKGLQAELGLSEEAAGALRNAALRDEGKSQHFREKNSGNQMTIQYISYHTVSHDDKIDLVFGKHEESMEVSGEVAALPSENCIQYNGALFAVWPPASPHSKNGGEDMKDLLTELPSGWKLVDSTQEGFANIRNRVIVPYGWHTSVLVTNGKDGKLEGWYTANLNTNAGEPLGGSRNPSVEKKGESSFKFTGVGWRLLIQAHPAANHELVNSWKRFVQLSAQREWSQRLGMIHGKSEGTDIFHG